MAHILRKQNKKKYLKKKQHKNNCMDEARNEMNYDEMENSLTVYNKL